MLCLLLLSACGTSVSVGDGKVTGTHHFPQYLQKDGKAVHDQYGAEEWFAYGAVLGTGEIPANGVGKSYLFQNGMFVFTLAINIEEDPTGLAYVAWLESDDGEIVRAGYASNPEGNARHFVNFDTHQDYRDYLKMIISLERRGGTEAEPSNIVAEGMLTPYQR